MEQKTSPLIIDIRSPLDAKTNKYASTNVFVNCRNRLMFSNPNFNFIAHFKLHVEPENEIHLITYDDDNVAALVKTNIERFFPQKCVKLIPVQQSQTALKPTTNIYSSHTLVLPEISIIIPQSIYLEKETMQQI